MVVGGPTQLGKTAFVLKLIKHARDLVQPPPEKILYCYGEYQESTFKEARRGGVQFHAGLPNLDWFDGKHSWLVILDDLMAEADQSVSDLFTKGSHHRNVSVIFIVQNLFQKTPWARTISLNSHYTVIFKSPRDMGQFSIMARQMYGKNWQFAAEAFVDATREPHTYLLIDMQPDTDENHRLRTQIFPGQQCFVYVDKRLYKAHTL
jgi:hypothetical protein